MEEIQRQELIQQYEQGYRKEPESITHLKALEKVELETLTANEKW